jgi:ribonuclease T2
VDVITRGFTLHGFWPNYQGSGYPDCCSAPYTRADIETMIGKGDTKFELDTYWPALKKCKFVEYEWDKHGTCAASVYNGTYGPSDYWTAAIGLQRKWDLYAVLVKNGFPPSTSATYETARVHDAIHSAVGKKPALWCDSSDTRLLLEVRMCVERPTQSTRLKPALMDCPSAIGSNCKHELVIPPIPTMATGGCK